MPRPYSIDLRERVIEAIAAGASRRETAEQFGLSPSVVIIWAQRWEATGSIAPTPTGGSVSPLDEHEDFILGLIKVQPDMTLDEIVAARAKAKIGGSRCPCRKLKLEHIDGVARPRSATNARALFGTHHAEPARPSAAIGAF